MNNIQSTHKGIYSHRVHIPIPLSRIKVRGDINSVSHEHSGRSLDLHKHWVAVKPSEQIGDRDISSKLINDNHSLTLITVPELCVGNLRVSIHPSEFPRLSSFTRSSWPPVDGNRTDDCTRSSKVRADSSKRRIITYLNLIKFITRILAGISRNLP